ncbi:ral-GDS-related protein-like [Manis javanica]|uniref:ral-GDS-related protein-like n=1 Tax=Manis javanica TaxID=9974 RepID=UPI003C6CDBF3
MRSCCVEPSEGVGVTEAERESLPARCGRWLREHFQRLCPCLPRSPEREPEPTLHATEVPKRRAPWTGVRRKWRQRTGRVEPAPNTSWSAPQATLPPEDADQPAMGQWLPRPCPSPWMGQARHLAWEPESVPSVLHGSQPSSILEGQVHHHLVQEEHLGPTVAEREALRWKRPRRHAWYILYNHCPQTVQELRETPVLELWPVSPASAPAQPEDVPAVASVPVLAVSTWDIPGVVSGPQLEPHDPSGPGPRAPARMAPDQGEPDVGLEPTSPCAASTQDMWRKEEPNILAFPPCLVAEQLTLMCAELFTHVLYSECEIYLWHRPQRGIIEHMVPTIYNVMRQFEAMVRLVTTTCLRTPSMTAQDRARVVEFWIRVAKECLYLRNYATLHAIVLALQSPAIRHLDSTWGHVSWKRYRMYKKLKKTDKGINREWLFEEARAMVKEQMCDLSACQCTKQGMVPFLGLILRDALEKQQEHHVDGDGMRERVDSHILHQIMLHRRVATQYDLETDELFESFLQAVELLDEEQSYTLSCQLEPPVLQSFRSHV